MVGPRSRVNGMVGVPPHQPVLSFEKLRAQNIVHAGQTWGLTFSGESECGRGRFRGHWIRPDIVET